MAVKSSRRREIIDWSPIRGANQARKAIAEGRRFSILFTGPVARILGGTVGAGAVNPHVLMGIVAIAAVAIVAIYAIGLGYRVEGNMRRKDGEYAIDFDPPTPDSAKAKS